MLSQSVQDYLKTIYKIQNINSQSAVSTTELSKELKVSGASVTGMLKRLDSMGLVSYNSYKGVLLSETGKKIALEVIRHHRLIELYLKEILGYSLEKVHDEACRLEHHISEEFEDKISDLLGNPLYDPHGHPIPTKDGRIEVNHSIPLADANSGTELVISRLNDEDATLLAYLEELKLIPNEKITILDKAPFRGPIKLIKDGKELLIGYEISQRIFVSKLDHIINE
jgi:DtxR family transcriptional regulator, Mn-dependent transcriptional regulator